MPDTSQQMFLSSDYFDALFINSVQNNVLLIDEKGIINAINQAFTNCFGYEPEDIIGKYLAVLFTEEDQKKGLPEKEIKNVLLKGQASDNNYLVSKDKTKTWVSGESIMVKNREGAISILKIIQNIHKQKEYELSSKHANYFNENILSSIEDAVIVIDERMTVIKANRAFTNTFLIEEEDGKLMNFAEFIKPNDTADQLLDNIMSVINSNKRFSKISIGLNTNTGEKRMYDVSCSWMQQNKTDNNNVLVVLHDITMHKQAEREREDLIGFVAHELRNPLANLVLCNEIMRQAIAEKKQDEIDDMLVRSNNNISRLNKMIAELYDATRINSGNMQLEISAFNFADLIDEAIETIEILQPSYNIVVGGDGDVIVCGDRYRLIQVVTNYLSNGIKYSNGKTDVTLTILNNEKTITVAVRDEGLGISPKQLPYIFERFFRAEKTKNLEGIGLGLYLCRQIIHAHNGKVWAESEEGKSSTFYFSIPLES